MYKGEEERLFGRSSHGEARHELDKIREDLGGYLFITASLGKRNPLLELNTGNTFVQS